MVLTDSQVGYEWSLQHVEPEAWNVPRDQRRVGPSERRWKIYSLDCIDVSWEGKTHACKCENDICQVSLQILEIHRALRMTQDRRTYFLGNLETKYTFIQTTSIEDYMNMISLADISVIWMIWMIPNITVTNLAKIPTYSRNKEIL